MDFRVFSRNISENMHARCVREDTKQALKGNLQADGVQSCQTLFVRYCPKSQKGEAFMKILHLSDLHLGRRMYNYSFLPQQKKLLEQVVTIAEEQAVQAVLVAGDIYDKNVPVAEAVTVLDEFLTALSVRQIPVFLISGNHDSAERLQFGSQLLEHQQVYIAGTFTGKMQTYDLEDAYGKIHLCLLPFVKQSTLASLYPDEKFHSLSEGIAHVLEQTPLSENDRNLLMYHGFVLHNGDGPELSESELQLGGTQLVEASVFSAFDYVALGHIHKPQWVKSGKIRYSGSLMKYSFSESLQNKSVTLLDWKAKDDLTVTTIPLQPEQDMRVIQGKLEDLLEHAEPSEDWIRAELTDKELIPYALERLRMSYPNVMELVYLYQEEQIAASNTEVKLVPEQSLVELMGGFLDSVYQYQLEEEPEAYQLMEEICKEAEQEK